MVQPSFILQEENGFPQCPSGLFSKLGPKSMCADPSVQSSSTAPNSLLTPRLSSLPLLPRPLSPWQRLPSPPLSGLGNSGTFPLPRWSFPLKLPGVPSRPPGAHPFLVLEDAPSVGQNCRSLFLLSFGQLPAVPALQGWDPPSPCS